MWLETETFQIDKNENLEVNIKIGEKLQGSIGHIFQMMSRNFIGAKWKKI